MADNAESPDLIQNPDREFNYPGFNRNMFGEPLVLTAILQKSLELQDILTLFHQEMASMSACDGLSFENSAVGIDFSIGSIRGFQCGYHLKLAGKPLGYLCFYRASPFGVGAFRRLEECLAALVYPLHNAMIYKRAVESAHRDPLTGVSNRTAMNTDLEHEMNLARRHNTALAMIILDIDRFKPINDTYGHVAGDAILKAVAQCMSSCARGGDVIYRYGGEEFVALLRNTNQPGAKMLAERIREAVASRKYEYNDFTVKITISAGLTSYKQTDTVESLIKRCDDALYQAKKLGRNRVIEALDD